MRRAVILFVQLGVVASSRLSAQCPDGSPSPCTLRPAEASPASPARARPKPHPLTPSP